MLGMNTMWLFSGVPKNMLECNIAVLCAVAALGALLPDLDASESKIKHFPFPGTDIKPFLPIARFVSRSDQHRGTLHSLLGITLVTVPCLPSIWWIGVWPVIALLLGYVSHLLADSMTKSGIRLLYPRPQRFHMLPSGWRFTTGSSAEEVLTAALTFGALCLLLTHM
jgi:inner membrane protein